MIPRNVLMFPNYRVCFGISSLYRLELRSPASRTARHKLFWLQPPYVCWDVVPIPCFPGPIWHLAGSSDLRNSTPARKPFDMFFFFSDLLLLVYINNALWMEIPFFMPLNVLLSQKQLLFPRSHDVWKPKRITSLPSSYIQ